MDAHVCGEPAFVQLFHPDDAAIRAELAAGLKAPAASIAPKYLYDTLGSRLFDAITALCEYYPTRTEAAVFGRERERIAARVGRGGVFVDLGAGSCAKASGWFDALQPSHYVAVDISVEFLREALAGIRRERPAMRITGVGQDFSARLELPANLGDGPRTLFYPGSSIGNFTPEEALGFLRQVRVACKGGHLIIGADLVKPREIVEPAYDDALGVTAAFNLNLLRNVNTLLGADFDERDWAHVAFFDATASRIEMHLQARCDRVVRWPGGERRFAAGERIHTENSYKYRSGDFEALLRDAGFRDIDTHTDERGWFGVFVASA